jgi:hypothetical protein
LKHGLTHVAEAVLAFAQQLIQHHPQYVTAGLTALLVGGAGATFAVASLAPDASDLPLQTVVETVQPLPLAAQIDALQSQSLALFRSDITRSTDTAETLLKRLGVHDAAAAAFLRSDPWCSKPAGPGGTQRHRRSQRRQHTLKRSPPAGAPKTMACSSA